jgi:hypothetical protein
LTLASRRADEEADGRHHQLQVDVQTRIVEEPRVEIAGPHHLDGAVHQLGLVDADRIGYSRAQRPEPEGRRDGDNGGHRKD